MQEHKVHLGERLREAGLRVTPQRRAVWSTFEGGENGHLTADEVFEKARRELPELARATVYNALGELVRAGLLQMVEGRGATLYDPNPDPNHHHFRCRACDRLYDVQVEGLEKIGVSGEGFDVDRKNITFTGTCPNCRAARAQPVT
ncbi:MAG: Fur family transcriptional regulator [Rubrobacteraceae bacterium]